MLVQWIYCAWPHLFLFFLAKKEVENSLRSTCQDCDGYFAFSSAIVSFRFVKPVLSGQLAIP